MRSAAVLGCLLVAYSVEAAASCPDYDAKMKRVERILSFDEESSISDALEDLAAAWLCGHPDATAREFTDWIASVPSGTSTADSPRAHQPTHLHDEARVVVLWRRGDIEAGGRAIVYDRVSGTGWTRTASLDLEGRPEIAGQLGRYIVIAEHSDGGRVDRLDLRTVALTDAGFEEGIRFDDLWSADVKAAGAKSLTLTYQRPARYSIDGSASRLEYELVLAIGKKGLTTRSRSRTPALATLDGYCGAADNAERRRHLKGAGLLTRMPDCDDLTVTDLVRARQGTYRMSIEASLVCEQRSGARPLREATVTVRAIGARYRITALAADGCDRVRARRTGEAL